MGGREDPGGGGPGDGGPGGGPGGGGRRGAPRWTPSLGGRRLAGWFAFCSGVRGTGPTEELGRACVKSEGVWLGAVFFFFPLLLNCADRKIPSTGFPGETGCAGPASPTVPPLLCRPPVPGRFSFPSCLPSLSYSPHLQPSRASQPVSGVSAKRPGHLSWQLHGACAVSSGKSRRFRSRLQPPFLFCPFTLLTQLLLLM